VKNGDEYVRVATNVKKDDGSRAIGTVLEPKGKAIQSINKGEPFYGEVDILGKPYINAQGGRPTDGHAGACARSEPTSGRTMRQTPISSISRNTI
jgi:hypothetical protein